MFENQKMWSEVPACGELPFTRDMAEMMTDDGPPSLESVAEAEITRGIASSRAAPADQMVSGIICGDVKSPIYNEVPAAVPRPAQYIAPSGGNVLFTYFSIRGLGEVPRLLLAESGAAYSSLAVTGDEDQADTFEWRSRSPNGLLPTVSGLGIPRAAPASQSGTILRFLAGKFGMAGQTPLEAVASDNLYETAKDLAGNKKMVVDYKEGGDKATSAKMPWALALRLEKMLLAAPSPFEPSSALTYGQIQLFHVLMTMHDCKPGCVSVTTSNP